MNAPDLEELALSVEATILFLLELCIYPFMILRRATQGRLHFGPPDWSK